MGKRDAFGKKYFSDPRRFADVVNAYIFDGEQRVLPESLRTMDPAEILGLEFAEETKDSKKDGKKPRKPVEMYAVQKMRDILKEVVIKCDDHCCYAIIGIENQTDIHYAMPVRNLVYDSLHYLAEVHKIGKANEASGKLKGNKDPGAYTSKFLKEDRITPVVTIVVYWGADEWIACRSLRELFPEDTPKEILKYTPDYTMPIIVPSEIKNFGAFRTEAGDVFRIVAASNDKDKLQKLVDDYLDDKPLDPESIQTLNAFLGANIHVGKEGIVMCKAIDDIRAESAAIGKAEGIAEGKAEGESKLAALITAMSTGSDTGNIAKAAADPAFREEMYKKYGIE